MALRKDADARAQRNGLRATVHLTNGDEYTGEWANSLKHGPSRKSPVSASTNYFVPAAHRMLRRMNGPFISRAEYILE